jgi:hypothetical protein
MKFDHFRECSSARRRQIRSAFFEISSHLTTKTSHTCELQNSAKKFAGEILKLNKFIFLVTAKLEFQFKISTEY